MFETFSTDMSNSPKKIKSISDLTPDPENVNDGSEYGTGMLDRSLREVGAGRGIVCERNGIVLAGNKTLEKAYELGMEIVPVYTSGNKIVVNIREDLDYEQNHEKVRKMALYDNRVSEVNYVPNFEQLLKHAETVDVSGMYSAEELARYKAILEKAENPENNRGSGGEGDRPPKDKEPIASRFKLGSIYKVGNQYIICGDCRKPETWDWVRQQKTKFQLVFTSPPYADRRDYDENSGFKPIPPDNYVSWFDAVQQNIQPLLVGDGSFCINIKENVDEGQRHLYVKDLTIAMVRSWGWMLKEEFACVHNGTPARVWFNFKNGWEPVFQFTRHREIKIRPERVAYFSENVPQGGGGNVSGLQGTGSTFEGVEVGEGLAYPTNVWKFYRNHEANDHDAAFAPEFPEQWIKAYTDSEDWVCDPFSGSGSTLIACQENYRNGVGVEISPDHAERSLRRLEQRFGLEGEAIG